MKRLLSIALALVLVLSVSVTAFAQDKAKEESEKANVEQLKFTTVDIYGKEWDTESLKDYKLVMINEWESWCPPCMGEIPDLELLYQKYKDDGFLLLGVTSTSASDIQTIIEKYDLSYPMLEYTQDFSFLETGYIPATFFLDSEGNIFTHEITNSYDTQFTYIGAKDYDEWDSIIREYLDLVNQESLSSKDIPIISLKNPCTISFVDKSGNLVPGVSVQICTDSLCTIFESDKDGVIKYTSKEKAEAHILSLPDGYVLSGIVEGKKEIRIVLE